MRKLLLLAVLWLLCGCAHGSPVFAFPPTGSDDPTETAATETAPQTSSDEVPNVLRTSLVARATRANVLQVTCALRPTLVIGGHPRPLDLHVDGAPCAGSSPQGIRANVDGNHGVLELEVPQGATPSDVSELQQGLADVSRELARRLRAIPYPVTSDAPVPKKVDTKRSTRWFVAAVTLGGIGLVMLGVGASLTASNDRGAQGIGDAIMASTALPLGVAAAVTAVVGLILLATE